MVSPKCYGNLLRSFLRIGCKISCWMCSVIDKPLAFPTLTYYMDYISLLACFSDNVINIKRGTLYLLSRWGWADTRSFLPVTEDLRP